LYAGVLPAITPNESSAYPEPHVDYGGAPLYEGHASYDGSNNLVKLDKLHTSALALAKATCPADIYEAGEFLRDLVMHQTDKSYNSGDSGAVWGRNHGVENYFRELIPTYPELEIDRMKLVDKIRLADQLKPVSKMGGHGPHIDSPSNVNALKAALEITHGNYFKAATLVGSLGHDDVGNLPSNSNLFAQNSIGVLVDPKVTDQFKRASEECVKAYGGTSHACDGANSAFYYHVNFGFYLGCQLAKRGFGTSSLSKFLVSAALKISPDSYLEKRLKEKAKGNGYEFDICTELPELLGHYYKKTTMEQWLTLDAKYLLEQGYNEPFLSDRPEYKIPFPKSWSKKRRAQAIGNLNYRLLHLRYGSKQAAAGAEAGARMCKAYKDSHLPPGLSEDAKALYDRGNHNPDSSIDRLNRVPAQLAKDKERLRKAWESLSVGLRAVRDQMDYSDQSRGSFSSAQEIAHLSAMTGDQDLKTAHPAKFTVNDSEVDSEVDDGETSPVTFGPKKKLLATSEGVSISNPSTEVKPVSNISEVVPQDMKQSNPAIAPSKNNGLGKGNSESKKTLTADSNVPAAVEDKNKPQKWDSKNFSKYPSESTAPVRAEEQISGRLSKIDMDTLLRFFDEKATQPLGVGAVGDASRTFNLLFQASRQKPELLKKLAEKLNTSGDFGKFVILSLLAHKPQKESVGAIEEMVKNSKPPLLGPAIQALASAISYRLVDPNRFELIYPKMASEDPMVREASWRASDMILSSLNTKEREAFLPKLVSLMDSAPDKLPLLSVMSQYFGKKPATIEINAKLLASADERLAQSALSNLMFSKGDLSPVLPCLLSAYAVAKNPFAVNNLTSLICRTPQGISTMMDRLAAETDSEKRKYMIGPISASIRVVPTEGGNLGAISKESESLIDRMLNTYSKETDLGVKQMYRLQFGRFGQASPKVADALFDEYLKNPQDYQLARALPSLSRQLGNKLPRLFELADRTSDPTLRLELLSQVIPSMAMGSPTEVGDYLIEKLRSADLNKPGTDLIFHAIVKGYELLPMGREDAAEAIGELLQKMRSDNPKSPHIALLTGAIQRLRMPAPLPVGFLGNDGSLLIGKTPPPIVYPHGSSGGNGSGFPSPPVYPVGEEEEDNGPEMPPYNSGTVFEAPSI
jgi:hypothetical protein